MNRYLIRFVSCLLVPAMLGVDPSWAIGITSATISHSSILHPIIAATPFDTEAVVQRLDAGFDGSMAAIEEREAAAEELHLPVRRGMSRRKALIGIGMLFAAPAAALAQSSKPSKPQARPVVKRPEIPQAAVVERQNRLLTDAEWEDAWYLPEDKTDPQPLMNQLPVVTNNSTKAGQKFYAHRAAWESLLAVRTDDGKYVTNRSDQLHGAGAGTDMSAISQALSYPGVSATQPKRQMETADFEPVSKSHPGFLHWRTLAQYAGRALRVALDGVQFYSKNQVEMSYLLEHAAEFKVREGYVDIETAVHEDHVAAAQAWLDYATQAETPAELREAAWIETRLRDREKIAAPREGRPLTEWERLQGTCQRAVQAFHTSHNDLEPLRAAWLGTIGHTENDLSREASTSLHPQGSPAWPMTRDLFNLADVVAPLVAKEGAAKNVFVPETLPLPPANEWDASRPSLPDGSYAPDDFLKIGDANAEGNEIDETVASELESLFTATPADAPLGTSPRQRWLKLEKESIETGQEEMLELQKLPAWNVGAHVDLGTQPFIAALLNWDYRRPGRSKILSLGELQIELALRAKEIDQEVIGDRKHIRSLWLDARAQRQTALAKLVDVRNQIVTDQTLRTADIWKLQHGNGRTSADPVTPALHIEQLKKEYARHLTEAWAAWQIMRLYTVEGQERVVAETRNHYMRVMTKVMQKIDPAHVVTSEELNPPVTPVTLPAPTDANGAPVAKPKEPLLRRVLHTITKGLGVIIPGLLVAMIHLGTATVSSAHTFVAQTAGAAAQAAGQLVTGGGTIHQVAVDAALGHFTGGHENNLWGIAIDVLKALKPDHKKLSSAEIKAMVEHIRSFNGNIDPLKLNPKTPLHLGSFDHDAASRLQAHNFQAAHSVAAPATSVQAPVIHHAATVPSVPAAPLPGAPAPATLPTHHGNGFFDHAHRVMDSVMHSLSQAGHFAWNWTWASPDHYLLVIGGVIALFAIIWILNRKGALPPNGSPFRPFSVNGSVKHLQARSSIRTWLPLFLAIASIGKLLLPYLGRVLSMAPHVNVLWAIPAGILLLSWLVFSRSRWRPLVAVPLLLLASFFGLHRGNVVERTGTTVSAKVENFKNADYLAINTGVSGQPVRYEVPWTPGRHSGGVVTRVKKAIAPGDLMIAMDPLDEALASRARAVNAKFFEIYGVNLIDPNLINAATRPRAAFLHIKPDYETSFDTTFSDWLEKIESVLRDHQTQVANAKGNEKALNAYALSYDGKAQYFRLRGLGAIAGSFLSAREESNVPCKPGERPQFVPGTGTITVGTRVREGEPTILFTRAFPEDDLRQIKMTPRDARILVDQWHKNPIGTTLQLQSKTDGTMLRIPLSAIETPVGPEDPTFGKEVGDESIFGSMYSNPAIGASPTIPISVIIRHPGRTLKGQKTDLGTAYNFKGIFEGTVRLTEAPPAPMTVGVISVSLPPASQPPQHTMLGPLEEQIKAVEAQLAGFDSVAKDVAAFQTNNPEREAEPILLDEFDNTRSELQSKLDGLRRERDEILAAGIHGAPGNVQPRDAFRHKHYPLVNPVPTASLDEGFVEWGQTVLTHVSFYADPNDLPGNNRINIRIPNTDRFVEFTAAGGIWSQDRTRGLKRYRAEAELPLAVARQFFPPHQPFTTSWAEVQLNPSRSMFEAIKDWRKGVPSPSAVTVAPASAGPSRLKGGELLTAFLWVAAAALAAFVFGIDSHFFLAPIGGFVSAVVFHEYVGHGLAAWIHVKRPTRLRRIGWNLEWQVQTEGGNWETLLDRKSQEAGRSASRFLILLGPAFLIIQIFFGFHIVALMVVVYAVLASLIFQNADQQLAASEEDAADLAELDRAYPLPRVRRRSSGESAVSMSRERRMKLRDSSRDTVLENERYWYKGQDKTYLTLWQRIWDIGIVRKKKVKLALDKVLYRRVARDNVSSRQASLIATYWELLAKEGIAGAKTRTFLWVLASLFCTLIYLITAGPEGIRDFFLTFMANPMLLFAAESRNLGGKILVTGVGLWILIGILEALGKILSTGKWNLEYLKQRFFYRLFITPEQRFHEKTGYEVRPVLEELDKVRILMASDPGTGELRRGKNEYDEFLDNLHDFARLSTFRALLTLDRDPPDHPSEESLAFSTAFRIQVTRTRSSDSPIYRGIPVPLASEATLKAQVQLAHPDFDDLDEQEQYRLMTLERVEEAKRLAEIYPMHALIALLRSGNTDLLTDLDSLEDGGLNLEIIDQLKERLNTLDADAYDALRAQERFHDFFDSLHYVYAGLCRPITTTAERDRRDRLLEFLHGAVSPMEEEAWKNMVSKLKSAVPDSLSPDDAHPEDFTMGLEERDPNLANLVRGISYVLTARLQKEDEAAALRQLQDLRDQIPHTRRDVSQDKYLRDKSGNGSTSVVQLKMAYQKYFDLLSGFIAGFHGIRILRRRKRNIYITLENTVNFRQTLREIALLLQMTDRKIYLVNAGETQNLYADRLERAIAERFSWSERGRIKVRSIKIWNVWKVLRTPFGKIILPRPWAMLRSLRGSLFAKRMQKDKNALILSSATPLEWRNVQQCLGAKVHGTSPLLKLALFVGLVPKLDAEEFALVCQESRHYVAVKYRTLRARKNALASVAEQSEDLQKEALRLSSPRKIEPLSTWNWLRQLRQEAPLAGKAVSVASATDELGKIEKEIKALATELNDLNYMEYEFRNVKNFLPLINAGLIELDNNEPPPKIGGRSIFVPDDPLDPNYVLKWQAYVGPNDYMPRQDNSEQSTTLRLPHSPPLATRMGA